MERKRMGLARKQTADVAGKNVGRRKPAAATMGDLLEAWSKHDLGPLRKRQRGRAAAGS
jgi:hypothetical protein